MAEHLELAHRSRRGVPSTVYLASIDIDGHERLSDTCFIQSLGAPGRSRLSRSQFVRLSQELEEGFSDLRGTQVKHLRDLCRFANSSEEFFFNASEDQWLRTVIICDRTYLRRFIPRITIHSMVVPCHPYWTKLRAIRDEAALEVANKRLYFPSTFLEDALSDQQSLRGMLNAWPERDECQCAIPNQFHGGDDDEVIELRTLRRPFWTIAPDDVKVEKRNFGNGGQATVQKVSWRGGSFVRKFFKQECEFETELDAVLRISHPHVVHTFGLSISADGKEHSLLMELLDTDLFLLIEKKASSEPPFSREESIDILVQIAKAMTHVHGLAEPVIHGDLKPGNILVSECKILGNVRQYLVKVADFGSAKILNNSTFSVEGWTTRYAAPELLEKNFFPERNVEIRYPKKIDVYSFGIIAFQVLTGLVPYEEFLNYRMVSSERELKKGVISGELRPRLREACSRLNFWNEPALMALVESCWHHEPSNRPEFSEVTDRLERI